MPPLPLWERSEPPPRIDERFGEVGYTADRPLPLTPTLSHKGMDHTDLPGIGAIFNRSECWKDKRRRKPDDGNFGLAMAAFLHSAASGIARR